MLAGIPACFLLLVVYNWRMRLPSDRFIVKPLEPERQGSRGRTQLDFLHGKTHSLGPGPTVLMVTAAPSGCMKTAWGASAVAKVLKNHADYARLHQYDLWVTFDQLDQELPPEWNKVVLLRKLIDLYRFQYDWFWWLDHETVITDLHFSLPLDKYSGAVSLVLGPSEDWAVYHRPSYGNINLGTFLLKNNFWSKKLLETLQATRDEAVREDSEMYSAVRESVQGMPAVTDQAVLLYLLYSWRAQESTKKHIVFEAFGFGGLEGAWKEAMGKLKGEQGQPHPEGDGLDPPFVLHFGGCQLCTEGGDRGLGSCHRHFGRALNYADNQVLEGLHLRHMESGSASILQDLPQPGN